LPSKVFNLSIANFLILFQNKKMDNLCKIKEPSNLGINEEILKLYLINHTSLYQANYPKNIKMIFKTLPNTTLEIIYGWFDSPYGPMLLSSTEKGICGLAFKSDLSKEETKLKLFNYWPNANFQHNDNLITKHASSILENKNSLSIHMIGTPFQTNVWKALLTIPIGNITTYSDVACHLKNPNAVRAIANAIGKNPICWLIPCHRVIRKSGGLGGYRWGLNIKNNLLASEF
jgi:O-6-methylguanine DNA methyltransferase